MHPEIEEEVEIREMEGGLDPQRDFEQRGPELDIPPPPHRLTRRDHPLSHHSPSFLTQRCHLRHFTLLIMHLRWIYLLRSTHLALQATFEHLQQSIERIESRQESQHEEMMAYLRSMFPPPQP
ncbi:hypothetical protein AAG906_001116 [Vitis piasezkii]